MSANTCWARFLTALEARGLSFELVAQASDRASVIAAAGLKDAFDIAVVETEWLARMKHPLGSSSFGAAAVTAQGSGRSQSTSSTVAPNPRNKYEAFQLEQLGAAPEEVQDGAIAAELLAALVGHQGPAFFLRDRRHECSPLVPTVMRAAVAPALLVADAYVHLSNIEEAEFNQETSLVSMALGEVVSEITSSYAHQISLLTKASKGKSMPLMSIISEAQRIGHAILLMRQVLPKLCRESDDDDTLVGGVLLNHLHEHHIRCASSTDDERLLAVLMRRATRPYLNIMRQWILEGILKDPFGEFFISESASPSIEESRGATKPVLNLSVAAFRDLVSGPGCVSSSYAIPLSGGANSAEGVAEVYFYDRRFILEKSRIPSFLLSQGRVAKMVLYSGKYCCLLREFNGALPDFTGLSACNEDSWQWTNAEALHRMIEEVYHRASASIIKLLKSPSIDLVGHLSSLKNYFFQDRGDWLSDFLDAADELLYKSPVQVKAQSVRVLLQTAVTKACGKFDPYHAAIGCSFADTTFPQYIELSLRQAGQPARGSGRLSTMKVETRRCIELLQLEVDLRWPITLVLDPLSLKHMNNVFRLLLWVKVCERSLQRWWHRGVGTTRAHGIKHQMIQFIRQFQFYAAHFVIEPQWGKMMGRMSNADDVLAISHALEDFFVGLEHGLIMSSLPRFRTFAKLLDLMSRFGELGKVAPGRSNDAQLEEQVRIVEDNFLKLLAELASPRGEDYPQLVPLLTWIDFSRFYDQKGIYKVQQGTGSGSSVQGSASAGDAQVTALQAARMAASSSSRSSSLLNDVKE